MGKCDGCGKCLPCPAWIEIDQCAQIMDWIQDDPDQDYRTDQYKKIMKAVKNCIRCKRCEKLCPQELDVADLIRRNLENYEKYLMQE